jgi:hypothetical protein
MRFKFSSSIHEQSQNFGALMKRALLFAPLFLLTACEGPNSITGTLSLRATTPVRQSNGQSLPLSAGSYSAQAKMGSGSGTLTIKTKQGTLRITVPQLAADSSGNFSASAVAIGQEFSVKGRIFNTQSNFDRKQDQSCVSGSHQQCSWSNDADGHSSYGCQDVNDYGTQPMHQVGYDSYKNVQINLIKGSVLGTFSGSYTLGEKFTTNQAISSC